MQSTAAEQQPRSITVRKHRYNQSELGTYAQGKKRVFPPAKSEHWANIPTDGAPAGANEARSAFGKPRQLREEMNTPPNMASPKASGKRKSPQRTAHNLTQSVDSGFTAPQTRHTASTKKVQRVPRNETAEESSNREHLKKESLKGSKVRFVPQNGYQSSGAPYQTSAIPVPAAFPATTSYGKPAAKKLASKDCLLSYKPKQFGLLRETVQDLTSPVARAAPLGIEVYAQNHAIRTYQSEIRKR